MVLTDEFSASGGDMLPAIIQSNKRGPIFGWRTMGAGGSVVGFSGPAFTESIFRITVSLMNRLHVVNTPDFPPAPYIENIGVRPDIPVDYMTRANLMNAGADFVQAFITGDREPRQSGCTLAPRDIADSQQALQRREAPRPGHRRRDDITVRIAHRITGASTTVSSRRASTLLAARMRVIHTALRTSGDGMSIQSGFG